MKFEVTSQYMKGERTCTLEHRETRKLHVCRTASMGSTFSQGLAEKMAITANFQFLRKTRSERTIALMAASRLVNFQFREIGAPSRISQVSRNSGRERRFSSETYFVSGGFALASLVEVFVTGFPATGIIA